MNAPLLEVSVFYAAGFCHAADFGKSGISVKIAL